MNYGPLIIVEDVAIPDYDCKRCGGTGMIPIPWWRYLVALLIERIDKRCISKTVWCKCVRWESR
jgi:hypothetical protein